MPPDPAEAIALAPGISCFKSGMEYAHGGLTLQEALIPSLTVTAKPGGGSTAITLKGLKWAGLRLNVALEGAEELTVDIRSKAADATTSFTAKPAVGAPKGKNISLLVADDEAQGKAAFVVVLDREGQPIFKHSVVIGEN
jgi:hypothetical protein